MTPRLIFPPLTDAEARDAAGWLLYHELTAPREQLTFAEYLELCDAALVVLRVTGSAWDEVIKEWAGRVSCPMKKGA